MTVTYRPLPLAALVVGFALASGCGRTEMGVLARASDNAGGTTAGQTGSESNGAGGGAGSNAVTRKISWREIAAKQPKARKSGG